MVQKLITVEEHYNSLYMNGKVREILEKTKNHIDMKAPGAGSNQNQPDASDAVYKLGSDRIAHMDAVGIDAQVISFAGAMPAIMEPEISIPLCRKLNDESAEKAAQYPGRFYFFAHLPLGDGQEAAAELERCVKELGFVGAMITGHYHDLPYDDELYYPIFEKAQELDVPIYLHPGFVSNTITDYYYKGSWSPQVTALLSSLGIGWHYDVGMQILRLMFAGVFDKLPDLKIMTGHWGELVSFYMYRTDEIPQKLTGLNRKISEYFKENIYVNPSGLLYPEQFRYCLDTFGPDHIMWGEDYPYRRKENIRSFLEAYDISDEDKEKIAHLNAEKLLHIQA